MITLHSTKVYFFDVDRTLVFTASESRALGVNPLKDHLEVLGTRVFFRHPEHLELIKDLKARGHTVVVWSAGGSHWAEAVVQILQMEEYVDLVMSKPDGFCDDKAVGEWMPEVDRFYIPIGEFTGGKK